MKTSIIISSLAALCLMITFTEAPSRISNDNRNAVSANEISFIPANSLNYLPVTNISASSKREPNVSPEVSVVEDFSYLKFKVADCMESDSFTNYEIEALPVKSESDFGYMKFDVTTFENMNLELPEYEKNTTDISSDAPSVSELSYLKFDVSKYTNSLGNETNTAINELPEKDIIPQYESNTASINPEFYLKFNVNNYYPGDESSKGVYDELPAME